MAHGLGGGEPYLHQPSFPPSLSDAFCAASTFSKGQGLCMRFFELCAPEREKEASALRTMLLDVCAHAQPNFSSASHSLASPSPPLPPLPQNTDTFIHVVLLPPRQHHGRPPTSPALGVGLATAPAQGPSNSGSLPLLRSHRTRPFLQRLCRPPPRHG